MNTRDATHTSMMRERDRQDISRSITAAAERLLPSKVVCAVHMSKSLSPVVGVSFLILENAMVIASEINDSLTLARTMNKIEIFEPTEIFVNASSPQKLLNILESNVNCKLSLINKRYFRNDFDILKKIAIDSKLDSEFKARELAGCTASAVLTYVTEKYPRVNKFRFKYEPCEAAMFIDTQTVKSLELCENLIDKRLGPSLFSHLNHTKTKMGVRILKNNILQPLTDVNSLQLRMNLVQELLDNVTLVNELRDNLKMLQDLDKIFNLILIESNSVDDQNINNIILIKQTIEISNKLSLLLETCDSILLKEIRQLCNNEIFTEIQESIEKYINEECSWANSALDLKNQKCYAVRSGTNGLLDVSRQLYHNVINEIISLVESLADEFELQLESQFDSHRGFTIKIKNFDGELDELPPVFINTVVKRRKYIECSTLDLIKLNSRMHNTMNEIILMSDQIIEELLDKVRGKIYNFFMMSEAIAVLDLLACFAINFINNSNYTFAEFNTEGQIVVKGSRHPILETLISEKFVVNDIISIHDTSRIQIITGPNMSGKSVYLRQVLLLVIIAQMGSAIPASYATLPLFKKLHARISSDNTELNASTFSAEMNGMVNILNEVTDSSLIIIDELGRGSSLQDGFAISLAITESLAKSHCTSFVSTHFNDIPKILSSKPGFMHLQMQTESSSEELVHHHKISKPSQNCVTEGYGILMARKHVMPVIVQDAMTVSKMLSQKRSNRSDSSRKDEIIFAKRKMMLNLIQNLKIMRDKDEDSILNVTCLQSKFIENFPKIG